MMAAALLSQWRSKGTDVRETEERLRVLLDTMPCGVLELDAEGRISFVNRALCTMQRCEASLLVGQRVWEFLAPGPEREGLPAYLALRVRRRDAPAPVFAFMQRCDETSYQARVDWNYRFDAAGELAGFTVVLTDISAETQATVALRESEARYRSLFQNNHAVMLLIDPEHGYIVDANPAAVRYYGWRLEQLRSMRISDINTLDPDSIAVEMGRATAEHRSHFFFSHRLASGAVRAVEVYCGPVEYYGKRLLLSIVHDIAARKVVEAALSESEASYRTLAQNLPGIVYRLFLREGSRMEFFNDMVQKLTGYTPEELTQGDICSLDRLIMHEDRDAVLATVRDAIAHETTFEVEYRLLAKSGEVRHFWELGRPLRGDDGRPYAIDGVIFDVTDRKRVEDELWKLAAVVQHCRELINLATLDGSMIFLNEAGSRMLGIPEAEIEGHRILDVIPVSCMPTVQNALLPALLQDGVWEGELQYRNQSTGVLTDVHATTFTLCDRRSGQPKYLANVSVDITQLKQTARELEALNRKLEWLVDERTKDLSRKAAELEAANKRLTELDVLKSAFLSTVSHELRTPLTAILGFAKLIAKEFGEHFQPLCAGHEKLGRRGGRIRDNLAIIHTEAERLTRLINDVLDVGKINSGYMQWHDQLVDPRLIIRKAAAAQESALALKSGVSLELDLPDTLPLLALDADKFEQLLLNLLGNAIKFTDKGIIHVEASCDAGAVFVVRVRDSGRGIQAEDLDKIFDAFYQGAAESGDGKPKGTGLGLAICRHIVEHYGGRIWAESQPGTGSVFSFILPCTGVALTSSPQGS